MAPPSKSNSLKHDRYSSDRTPTLNLWVGDLQPETTDHDLISVFGDFGALDALISYSPRTFAFVMFNNIEDSKRAIELLQGSYIKGRKIKIEFGRPTIPGKHIWIGGISTSVSKEQLLDELLQFGKIEEFKFIRDRNSAIVGYTNLSDAIAAQKNVNKKNIGGQQVRVDFQKPPNQRPESSKQERPAIYFSDNEPDNQKSNRQQPHGGLDDPPCNTLWVRYPPSVRMDKSTLHDAMLLFGEVEAIRTIPTKNYCFVVFRNVDEARRAKEGLDGRLFGDPRILVKFATSSLTHSRDNAPILPGYREPRLGKFINESPLGPSESFRPIHLQRFRRGHSSLLGPYSTHESELNSILGAHPLTRTLSSIWDDESDTTVSKRPRLNDSPPNNVPFRGNNCSPTILGHGRIPRTDIWHGVLAKGSSAVCYARCVAVGSGLESPLPQIVDCFARTDLDKLKRQYNEASGFDSVFFYPASEKDFGPYTEFLRYLSDNNRVGVAKCSDETHLFLIPPSDFLTKVLKITGPERLYGVVFKSSRRLVEEAQRPHIIEQTEDRNLLEVQQPRYIDQIDYNLHEMQRTQYTEQWEDHNLHNSNDLIYMNENLETTSGNYSSMHGISLPVASATHASKSEIPLTSDILSLLTSLLPLNTETGAGLNNNVPLASSLPSSSFIANDIQDHQPHYPTYNNSTQFQNLASNVPQPSADPTGHFNNYVPPEEQTIPNNQHFQLQETYYDPYSANSYDDSPSSNTPQNQIGPNADYFGLTQSGQVTTNIERLVVNSDYHDDDEKTRKYRKTLDLAATLLQQLRQPQQNGIRGNHQ